MKRLFLLRHAQAVNSANTDKERALSETGVRQAFALGKKMSELGLKPQMSLCSPAVRTVQTLEAVCKSSGLTIPSSKPEKIYNSQVGLLLSAIQSVAPQVESLLLVNHNPAIHQLAFMLAGPGKEADLQNLSAGYAPCTLSVLDFDTNNWKMVSADTGKLSFLIPPLV